MEAAGPQRTSRWPTCVGLVEGRALVRVIWRFPVAQPITDAYEDWETGGAPGVAWYSSQKEHLPCWLSEIDGPGAFNRQSRNWNAKNAYNHFQRPAGLLWLAEALGEGPDKLTGRRLL